MGSEVLKNKRTKVDIWGCCVPRDSISIGGNDIDFDIGVYAQGCSPLVQFTEHYCPALKDDDFKGCAQFLKKSFTYDSNKTLLSALKNSDSDWIIVDLRTLSYGAFKINTGGNCYEYVTYDRPQIKKDTYSSKGFTEFTKLEWNEISIHPYFECFVDFLKQRYHHNIILLEVLESVYLQNSESNTTIDTLQIQKIEFESKMNYEFVKQTHCHTIKCPEYIPADCYHRWGFEPVHFVEEYYTYVYKCILAITRANTNVTDCLSELYFQFKNLFISINSGKYISERNAIHRIGLNVKSNPELSKSLINSLVEQGSKEVYGIIGRAYRDGTLYPKNIGMAIENMRIAAENNVYWARPELFDLLWVLNDSQKYPEMIEVALKGKQLGDANCMVRLARAYRDGKGVEKNISEAIALLNEATEVNGWAFKCLNSFSELFDLYWSLNQSKLFDKMIDIANKGIERGDIQSTLRLARAYRDGKGVIQDLQKSRQLMRIALSKGLQIESEFFDLLWIIGTKDSYEEMVRVITPAAIKGNSAALMRLGRAYREGYGVQKDVNQAIQYMRSATDLVNNKNWNSELNNLLVSPPRLYRFTRKIKAIINR